MGGCDLVARWFIWVEIEGCPHVPNLISEKIQPSLHQDQYQDQCPAILCHDSIHIEAQSSPAFVLVQLA